MAIPLKFDEWNNTLKCPYCSSNYLHHSLIDIFSREEDALNTRQTQVNDGFAVSWEVASNQCANPSDRRDGLIISFWCEQCGQRPQLGLAQHKGVSILEWTEASEPRPPRETTAQYLERLKQYAVARKLRTKNPASRKQGGGNL